MQPRRCGRLVRGPLRGHLRKTGKHASLLPLGRDFSPEPSDQSFQNLAPDECGASSLLPSAIEAKGSGTPTDAGLVSAPAGVARALISCPPPFAGKAFEGARSPVGVPPRLSPRGLTSPRAQLRPCFLGRGLCGCCPPSPVPVQ